jgi:integrase
MAGRASNGESTIYKGADGRWHGYVSVGFTLDGTLDRRHVSSKTRGVVVAKVRELERKRDSGTVSETSTPTVAAWLEHWLANIAPRRVRQRTVESYESSVRRHLIPGIGRHRLDRLRPEHLDQLYTQLLDSGYSPATVLRDHRILSRALTVAMQRGHIARNVATLVDPPRQQQSDLATALASRRRAPSSRPHEAPGTKLGGPSPSPSACGSPRRSRCSGRTSTCSPTRSRCGAASTGSVAA